ncbi:UNVERIFIED_CONTAM: hypothetical protein FKN15_056316 [Acipenser sinensis]
MNWKLQQGWRAPPIPRTAWRGTQQQQQRGLGINRLGVRGKKLLPAVGKRRAQGIVTWLAARKPGALQKGISPLNRTTFTQMVQTHLPTVPSQPPMTQRTRQWRTSTTDGGILTVSIDNPTARTVPPDPPRPRILRPPMPPAPLKLEDLEEKKVPKGVPLEFDINSVGKQTALTLNERFKILKDQRTAVAQTKGSRFVTVGILGGGTWYILKSLPLSPHAQCQHWRRRVLSTCAVAVCVQLVGVSCVMAAVVLLSVESSGPGFGIGGQNNSGTGTSGNGHGVAGPASWNRSLDRALDEASVTGSLNLSGRKLKEFPKSAANHDLTDTTQADLSRNRLSELPMEVCHFVSLESLNLYQNCIRQVPDSVFNLQSLSYLNISRNQLSTLPGSLCSLPLKVLIACNNKLLCLPEEIGHLRQLTELDVSCNEIQTLPSQVGQLEALRDLNIRRNHLVRLPVELAELPLVRIDFSCNKIATIPVCYRNLRHLQTIVLENNPLQSPPAQICIKGKIHIFKYLNIEACKIAPDLPEYDRRPTAFGSCHEDLYPSRTYGALDSGFNSVDSGDKRWSGNEQPESLQCLSLAVEHDVEQIDFIDSCPEEDEEARTHRGADRDSLSSQFMAYIERRISHEGSPVKASPTRDSLRTDDSRRCHPPPSRNGVCASPSSPYNQCSHRGQAGVERARREAQLAALQYEEERQRTKQIQREAVLHFVKVDPPPSSSALPTALDFKHKTTLSPTKQSPTDSECSHRGQAGVERARREAQLAALQYEEERQRTKQTQREAVLHFVKHKTTLSPTRQSPTDSENGYQPLMVFEIDSNTNTIKRRPGTHKQNGYQPLMVFEIDSNTNTIKRRPGTHKQQNDERSPLSQSASFLQSALQSPPYPGPASPPSYRSPSHRPESFLFRAALREEVKRALAPAPDAAPLFPLAVTPTLSLTSPVSPTSSVSPGFDSEEQRSPQSDGELGEDSPFAEELRKNIESRLKVSLPSDLGAALTDGVVLCHLANHVRPRSVSSIHVPSPAVAVEVTFCSPVAAAQADDGEVQTERGELPGGVPQAGGAAALAPAPDAAPLFPLAVTPTLSLTSPVSPTSSVSPGFDSEEPRSPQSDGELGEDSPFAEELRKAQLCLPLHILETKGLAQVAGTVQALLELAPPKNPQLSSV